MLRPRKKYTVFDLQQLKAKGCLTHIHVKSPEEAAAAKQGVMTERQAQQLLDAQRSEEKALIFVPPEKKTARGRVFKDW